MNATLRLQKLKEIREVLKSLEWSSEPVKRQPFGGQKQFVEERVYTPAAVSENELFKLKISDSDRAAMKNGFRSLWVEYEVRDDKVFVWGNNVRALQRLLGDKFPQTGLSR